MKEILILLLTTTLLFATEKPDGGYATWEDFDKGTPTYSIDQIYIKNSSSSIFRGQSHFGDVVHIKHQREDGKTRKWRSRKHGPLTIVKINSAYYLKKAAPVHVFDMNPPSVILNYNKNYSWYTVVEVKKTAPTRGANGQVVSPGMTYHTTTHFALNMQTKEFHTINKHFLREILKEKPELAAEYEEARFKNRKALDFFKRYLNVTQ